MSWEVPGWWSFALLALAAYRCWRLAAYDAILDRWRQPLLKRIPEKLHEGVQCPWCFGAWWVALWWVCWVGSHHWTAVIAVPFALSTVVGLVSRLDPD